MGRMHADEVETSAGLAARLVAGQFPAWAGLPVAAVESAGTDNALYRLGDELVVRMPRVPGAVGQVEKEARWLPWLAPRLPLAIPAPVARGRAGEGYPWDWAVYRWLEGEPAAPERLHDLCETARALAGFVAALQAIDPAGGPPPGPDNAWRGEPLARRDAQTRGAIAELGGLINGAAATTAWEAALRAPEWGGPGAWLHGDLLSSNLLARDGRLSAVIDFGCLGVGDPACDLMPAWTLFSGESRAAFRAALAPDGAAWARGRGWALSFGLIALPYYRETNPGLAGIARRAIKAAVEEAGK